MKRKTLLIIGLFLMAATAAAQDGDLLGRINNLRTSKGLPAYSLNGSLAAAAQNQAQWMVDNGCMIAHTHPDGSNPRTRALAAGYLTADVSENIYCGSNASSASAWTFWVNSGIHYAGLINTRYKEVGVGIASGAAGTSFVLVFGNPGGPDYIPPAPPGGGGGSAGPRSQPSYVVGLDEHGNIQHQIQPGDTLGQIALIYGYTWADIPGMLALNGLSEADYRNLKVGDIFLVPPKSGTFTPAPVDPAAATPLPPEIVMALTMAPTEAPLPDTPIPTPLPEPTRAAIATSSAMPEALLVAPVTDPPTSSATPQQVAILLTPVPTTALGPVITAPSGPPAALVIALMVQVGILLLAGFEFVRRARRR